MNICLVGFGKMGKAVKSVCDDKGYNVVDIVDIKEKSATCKTLNELNLKKIDCVIDFSHPSCILSNIDFYINNSIPAVIGTTGWYDAIEKIKKKLKKDTKIIYSGNFSIGVAMLLKLTKNAAMLLKNTPEYDVAITEFHHTEKADSPSGTALMIAKTVSDNLKRKNKILLGNSDGKIKENELQISSIRLGTTAGIHSLFLDSSEDTIEIKHTAKNRNGFAKGSVECAQWLLGTSKNGLLSFDDYLQEKFEGVF